MPQTVSYLVIGVSLLLIVLNLLRPRSKAMATMQSLIGLPNTIIHEFCHAIMAVVTFGRANAIHIFSNGEGLAISTTGSWFSRTVVTLSGYIGASAFAYSFVWLAMEDRLMWVFVLFSGIAVFTLMYIRNFFGFFYVLLLNALWLVTVYYDAIFWQELFVYYLVIVCLAYSFYSAFVIMVLSFRSPQDAGDASAMRTYTYIPAQIWGIFFFAQACYFYIVSLMKIVQL